MDLRPESGDKACSDRGATSTERRAQPSDIDPALRSVFARAAYGFDPREIRARDYLTRYPFSSLDAIELQLRLLVDAGVLNGSHDDSFSLTDEAEQYLRLHTERVGESIDQLDLGDVSEEQVQKLLAHDHRILDGLRESVKQTPSPVFEHRLKGVHPEYDPPKRWHHWQLAWTMIAAHEDAEETIRVARGIDPLAWFARHELWFTARRPHRARMHTCSDLPKVAQRYAPMEDSVNQYQLALGLMKERGWLDGVGDACGLTAKGLEEADRDEAEVEEIFLSRWPDFSAREIAEMKDIADSINRQCEKLTAQADADEAERR
ncbi:hypothetical protein ACFLSZ_06845 [Candidatus Bipolaricaulota bacterium]